MSEMTCTGKPTGKLPV